mgnify:CR=1 FL=1
MVYSQRCESHTSITFGELTNTMTIGRASYKTSHLFPNIFNQTNGKPMQLKITINKKQYTLLSFTNNNSDDIYKLIEILKDKDDK